MSLEVKLYVECSFCWDMQEAQRTRKVCPFEGKNCEGEIIMLTRIECALCDFSDDWKNDLKECPSC